jgi:hypothetical protein
VTVQLPRIRTAVLAIWMLTIAAAALAEQVRVVRDGATIWRGTTGSGGVLSIAKAGTILEVLGRQDRWIIVQNPGTGERGYILAQQTEPVEAKDGDEHPTASPRPAQARRPAAPPPRRAPRQSFVYVGASLGTSSEGFVAETSVPKYLENEVRTTTYSFPWRPGFEIGGGTWITPHVSVGVLVSRRQAAGTATIDAQIPHPLYYNQPRTLTGETAADRGDTAVHAQIGFSAYTSRHLQVVIAGGPSYYWVEQEFLDQLSYTDAYPYDTVTFTGATTVKETAHAFGGNVEATALVPLSRLIAVQVSGRYLIEDVNFAAAGAPDVTSSGQFGVGVRVRF